MLRGERQCKSSRQGGDGGHSVLTRSSRGTSYLYQQADNTFAYWERERQDVDTLAPNYVEDNAKHMHTTYCER